jgi:hypothetical protein
MLDKTNGKEKTVGIHAGFPPKSKKAHVRASVAQQRGNVVFLRHGVVRRDRREPDAAA